MLQDLPVLHPICIMNSKLKHITINYMQITEREISGAEIKLQNKEWRHDADLIEAKRNQIRFQMQPACATPDNNNQSKNGI